MWVAVRKRVWELKRNARFWFFTVTFSVLFAVLITVLYKTQQQSSTSASAVFSSATQLSLSAQYAYGVRVAVVGNAQSNALVRSLQSSFPSQGAAFSGYPQLVLSPSLPELRDYIHRNTLSGFPYPLVLGYDASNTTAALNVTFLLGASPSQSLDKTVMSLLVASQALNNVANASFPNFQYFSYPPPPDIQGPLNGLSAADFAFTLYGPALLVFGLVFMLPSFTINMVKDKAAKRLFLRSGMTAAQYWIGNWVADVVASFGVALVGFVIMMAAQVRPFSDYGLCFALSLFVFSLSAPLLGYIVSFLFDVEETAQRWANGVFTLTYLLLTLPGILVSTLIRDETATNIAYLIPALIYPPIGVSRMLSVTATYMLTTAGHGSYAGLFQVYGYSFTIILCAQSFMVFVWALLVYSLDTRFGWIKRCRGAGGPPRELDLRRPIVITDLGVTYEKVACTRCRCHKEVRSAVRRANVAIGSEGAEIFCILGPNGAGKTSIMNVLIGDVVPAHGSATIFGLDCVEDKETISQYVSFVDQSDAQLDLLSLMEFCRIFAWLRKVDEGRIEHFLGGMGLSDARNKRLSELSGGQRRKATLIAALLNEPRILVVDEPTTGIDIGSKRFVHEMILEVFRRGGTVFLSSHSMDEVLLLASRIGIIVNGSLDAVGTLKELDRLYGAGFLVRVSHSGRVPDFLRVVLETLQIGPDAVNLELDASGVLHFTVSRDKATLPALFDGMTRLQAQFPDIKFSVADSTLASTFIRFVEASEKKKEDEDQNI